MNEIKRWVSADDAAAAVLGWPWLLFANAEYSSARKFSLIRSPNRRPIQADRLNLENNTRFTTYTLLEHYCKRFPPSGIQYTLHAVLSFVMLRYRHHSETAFVSLIYYSFCMLKRRGFELTYFLGPNFVVTSTYFAAGVPSCPPCLLLALGKGIASKVWFQIHKDIAKQRKLMMGSSGTGYIPTEVRHALRASQPGLLARATEEELSQPHVIVGCFPERENVEPTYYIKCLEGLNKVLDVEDRKKVATTEALLRRNSDNGNQRLSSKYDICKMENCARSKQYQTWPKQNHVTGPIFNSVGFLCL
ncbi:hypothetical protein GQX74_009482 [Glossina fuscipes]|nr:hypothetical protein GQX74_009482 [Glossina fuscipes]